MTTMKEAIVEAVKKGDARRCAAIASRFATYRDALCFAQTCTGIDAAAWDALMYEADTADSGDRA